jgi:hypothetical protein
MLDMNLLYTKAAMKKVKAVVKVKWTLLKLVKGAEEALLVLHKDLGPKD